MGYFKANVTSLLLLMHVLDKLNTQHIDLCTHIPLKALFALAVIKT